MQFVAVWLTSCALVNAAPFPRKTFDGGGFFDSEDDTSDIRAFHIDSLSNESKEQSHRSVRSVVFDRTVEVYLTRYGYLPQSDLETGALRTVDQLQDAVRNLQGFAGIPMTGVLDADTRKVLVKERCGVQDVFDGFRNRRKRFSLQGQRWGTYNLTWSLQQPPEFGHLSRASVRAELANALNIWARHTRLTFTELNDGDDGYSQSDIQIFFHRNYHGDGYPFDGPGSVLAHAFFPGSGRGGDAHFDSDESWSLTRSISREATSLFAVAVHEFGHSLGLSHSSVPGSLMFPWYSNAPSDLNLPDDDRAAIQHLYGSADDDGNNGPTVVTPRADGDSGPAPPTTDLIPTTDNVPQKCQTNFDAVSVIRGEMWAFKGKYFWRINKEGGTRDDPIKLSSFWYGLPANIDHVDAVYERENHDIVFFVGKLYYVMSGNSQLKYDPQPITKLGLPDTLDKVDGAMRWGWNGKTYFFSGTMYWRFDEDAQYIELDYPRDMSMWKGVPYHIDSVFQYLDRRAYFFKDKYFWEFDDQRMSVKLAEPTPVGEHWLHCPKEMLDPYSSGSSPQLSSQLKSQLFASCFMTILVVFFGSHH